MIPAYCPLQTKLMHTVSTPWLRFSTVEVVNRNPFFAGSRFDFDSAHSDNNLCVGGGLIDSTGPLKSASSFIATFMTSALSQHDVLERKRRVDDSVDPLAALRSVMCSARRVRGSLTAAFTEEELAQYSLMADVELLRFLDHQGPEYGNLSCEAVWFTAHRSAGNEIDITVSNVGSCRGFGIPRNSVSMSKCKRSVLDPTREPLVPLSMDHIASRIVEYRRIIDAGGKVENDLLDGALPISRSFGMRHYKSNRSLPQLKQQVIAEPTTTSWVMRPGDMMILSNRGAYLTRSQQDLSVDDLAHIARRGQRRGKTPAQIACDIADEAVVYGSPAGLQVLVAEAVSPPESLEEGYRTAHYVKRETTVLPGRLHVGALQTLPEYLKAFRADCARCGLSVEDFLDMRSQMVGQLKESLLLDGPLVDCFGNEAGSLRRAVEEEMSFLEPLFAFKDKSSLNAKNQLLVLSQALGK